MGDPRLKKLAEILVNHSLEVKKGERILIQGSTEGAPLIKEVYRKVLQQGAKPFPMISIPGMEYILFNEAGKEQLMDLEIEKTIFGKADGIIGILAPSNTKELTSIDLQKMKWIQEAQLPLLEDQMQGKIKWTGTQFPTNAGAQDADMSLEEYEDFVYGATNIDYHALKRSMEEAAAHFNAAKKVRIVANQTDITVDIEGRQAVVSYGKRNIPDGEFFFTPNRLKTEGTIYFDWPTVYGGREAQGVRLTFKEGKIVECSAEKGQGFLEETLDTDGGSRYLGELGIGTNFGITKPTKNTLYDEKIGGSIHLAIGRAYEIAGAGNESAIHWDMVKNLKDGGEIYLDGNLVQKNGKWCF